MLKSKALLEYIGMATYGPLTAAEPNRRCSSASLRMYLGEGVRCEGINMFLASLSATIYSAV